MGRKSLATGLAIIAIAIAATGFFGWRYFQRQVESGAAAISLTPTEIQRQPTYSARDLRRQRQTDGQQKPSDLPPSPESLEAVLPPSIAKWTSDWEAHELSGRGATDDELHELHDLLSNEAVDPVALCGLMRTIDFLDGHDATSHIQYVVLEKTTDALNKLNPPVPDAAPILAAMWPLHDYFNGIQEHVADRRLIESLRRWETRGSPHSQMVDYLYGENLYDSGAFNEAVAAFQDLEKERISATQPSEGINRPLDWDIALCLGGAGRYAEAAVRYAAAAQQSAPFSRTAGLSVPVMLYRAGQHDEAIASFKEVCVTYKLSATEIDRLTASMEVQQ